MKRFQFTRPRGARPLARPRIIVCSVFQFTRPRGARLAAWTSIPASILFQFTRPRGARRVSPSLLLAVLLFQFTRPRGARLRISNNKRSHFLFQFTRPRGARLIGDAHTDIALCFNSRAREGRDSGYFIILFSLGVNGSFREPHFHVNFSASKSSASIVNDQ